MLEGALYFCSELVGGLVWFIPLRHEIFKGQGLDTLLGSIDVIDHGRNRPAPSILF